MADDDGHTQERKFTWEAGDVVFETTKPLTPERAMEMKTKGITVVHVDEDGNPIAQDEAPKQRWWQRRKQ